MTKVSTIYYYRENPFTRNFPGGTNNPFVTSCSGTICDDCPLRSSGSCKER